MTATEKREEIKRARLERGMTQEDLARRTGINRPKISLYEQGFVALDSKELAKVEKVLKLGKHSIEPFSVMPLSQPLPEFLISMADLGGRVTAEILKERKRQRQEAGLSQHALAKDMGIHQSKLSEWESGKVNLTDEELTAWAKALSEAGGVANPYILLEKYTQLRDEILTAYEQAIEELKKRIDAAGLSEEERKARAADLMPLVNPFVSIAEDIKKGKR